MTQDDSQWIRDARIVRPLLDAVLLVRFTLLQRKAIVVRTDVNETDPDEIFTLKQAFSVPSYKGAKFLAVCQRANKPKDDSAYLVTLEFGQWHLTKLPFSTDQQEGILAYLGIFY